MTSKSNDAWVLVGIFHSEDQTKMANLRSIIAYCDYVNHAVISFDEFSSAIKNLLAADVISLEENCFSVTDFFRQWYTQTFRNARSISSIKELNQIEKFLSTLTYSDGNVKIHLSKEDFEKALQEYMQGTR